MYFCKALFALCEVLLMSTSFTSISAAALKKRSHEIQLLTGAALSDALEAAKLGLPGGNRTILRGPSSELESRATALPQCANDLLCAVGDLTGLFGIPISDPSIDEEYMIIINNLNALYAGDIANLIAVGQSQSQDWVGDIAQNFYLAFAENDYTLVTDMLSGNDIILSATVASSLVFNSIFSLAGLNSILPYCDDTTFDALAQRTASLVDAFLSQFESAAEGDNSSPTVVAANIDGNTGLVDGLSVGGTFCFYTSQFDLARNCPALGETW